MIIHIKANDHYPAFLTLFRPDPQCSKSQPKGNLKHRMPSPHSPSAGSLTKHAVRLLTVVLTEVQPARLDTSGGTLPREIHAGLNALFFSITA